MINGATILSSESQLESAKHTSWTSKKIKNRRSCQINIVKNVKNKSNKPKMIRKSKKCNFKPMLRLRSLSAELDNLKRKLAQANSNRLTTQ